MFICWFNSRMSAMAMLGQAEIKSQELHWEGSKYLNHLSLLSQDHQQGARLEVEQLGLKLVPTWDVGIADNGLTLYATALAPFRKLTQISASAPGACDCIDYIS